MRHIILFVLLLFSYTTSLAWGKTGHRIVGQIAENHLTAEAKANIAKILGHESLAMVSNYMDFIKADRRYNHMNPWHYCTIPDGMTYEEAGTPEEGDAIQTIYRLIEELKSKNFTDEDEAFALKCLVHLVGDVHQPLHVGNGKDKGGNDEVLEFMYESTNLHRIWDSDLIDHQQLSYTEYAVAIDYFDNATVNKLQQDDVMVWIYESRDLRSQVYDFPSNQRLSWGYIYDNIGTVDRRLAEAGVRLAGILNAIYG